MSKPITEKDLKAALKVLNTYVATVQAQYRSKSIDITFPISGADVLVIRGPKKFRERLLESVEEAKERILCPDGDW